MPNNNTRQSNSSGDDLGSTDEVKIFKDEGDREDETVSSENLLEEKSSLIDLTEIAEKCGETLSRSNNGPVFNKLEPHASDYNMRYLLSPYSRSNVNGAGLSVSMASKLGLQCLFGQSSDNLTMPPPAHCGIPPYQLDSKSLSLTSSSIYPLSSTQYPYTILSPDISSQVASWHTPSVYSATSNFRSTYPATLCGDLAGNFPFRLSSNLLPPVHTSPYHSIKCQPTIITACSQQNGKFDSSLGTNCPRDFNLKCFQGNNKCKNISNDKKKPHIKKPLNAFMLYMKEMRAKVVAECTLKESAAINQILGKRWHELSREEQAKYYEKARQERQLHMELYPGWSARDNYGYVSKKKKRKKDKPSVEAVKHNINKC